MYKTQDSIKSNNIDFSSDNLFTGVWRLGNDNINRFDPFIPGYATVIWTKLPVFMDDSSQKQFRALTEKNFKAFSGLSDISLEVESLAHGFTGNELPVATTIRKENTTFNLRHYELAGSPIRQYYTEWITGIRDPETGLATYNGKIKDQTYQYSMKNHTGELLYIVTDPSNAVGGASGIEFACYYTNVFPTKIPLDHLNYSSGDHGLVETDIEFRGNFHMSKDINDMAVKAMQTYAIKKTYGEYNSLSNVTSYVGYNEK